MSWHFFIAKRYLWSKRKHPFVGVVSTISVLGITVGVAALIAVLAVMNGFDEDLKSRIIGMRSHLVIEKEEVFEDHAFVASQLDKMKEVKAYSPYVEGQALLQVGEWGAGVLLRGIDTQKEKKVSKLFDYMQEGALSEGEGGVAVGVELARRAHLEIGSEVLIATQNTKKPARFKVEGIFSSGMFEYDANLLFVSLASAQKIYDMPGRVSGLSVDLKDAGHAQQTKEKIQTLLNYPFIVRTWMDMNRTLFSALKLEKLVMFLILALIILVACLNIAGSLTILVMDKTKEIGVMRALGATSSDMIRIFAFDGLTLGLMGSLAGLLLGALICWVLQHTTLLELPKEIYYVDRIPVVMNIWDTLRVVLVGIGLSFLSALYPAWTAGRLDPVKALRYE